MPNLCARNCANLGTKRESRFLALPLVRDILGALGLSNLLYLNCSYIADGLYIKLNNQPTSYNITLAHYNKERKKTYKHPRWESICSLDLFSLHCCSPTKTLMHVSLLESSRQKLILCKNASIYFCPFMKMIRECFWGLTPVVEWVVVFTASGGYF